MFASIALIHLAIPLAEIARRRAARVVHQNVGLRTSVEGLLAALGRCDVGHDGDHLHAGLAQDLLGRGVERFGAACDQRHVHAFARQSRSATFAESFAGRAHQRCAPTNAQVHFSLPTVERTTFL